MYMTVDRLYACIRRHIECGDLEGALRQIKTFVELIVADDGCTARVFSSKDLDALCMEIGRLSLQYIGGQAPVAEYDQKLTVWLATELYAAGGHTAVLQDLIEALPQRRHMVISTGIMGAIQRAVIEKRFAGYDVELVWAPEGALLEKLSWLQRELLRLRPQQVFLFNHHQDVVAVAAVQPELQAQLCYYHHADHQLALGVHLPHALHIDPHNMGFFNCRDALGVSGNVYLPMTVPDRGGRSQDWVFARDGMVTCSSGSLHKFETPYRYSYLEIVPQLLQTTGGKHVHIGPLSSVALGKIRAGIAAAGISLDKFIHVPLTPSVWQALLDHRVDVYLVSFPHGGGRASIEVMGSATPVVVHQHYRSRFLGGADMLYAEACAWENPSGLMEYLGKLSVLDIKRQSALARSHYEHHHRPELLNVALRSDFTNLPAHPIPLRRYIPDQLQCCLDGVGRVHWLLVRGRLFRRQMYRKWNVLPRLAAIFRKFILRR
jgi:hypothetical protein